MSICDPHGGKKPKFFVEQARWVKLSQDELDAAQLRWVISGRRWRDF
jgi:hypothetical protein